MISYWGEGIWRNVTEWFGSRDRGRGHIKWICVRFSNVFTFFFQYVFQFAKFFKCGQILLELYLRTLSQFRRWLSRVNVHYKNACFTSQSIELLYQSVRATLIQLWDEIKNRNYSLPLPPCYLWERYCSCQFLPKLPLCFPKCEFSGLKWHIKQCTFQLLLMVFKL